MISLGMEMTGNLTDSEKAHICLALTLVLFVTLTFIAFLFNEGKPLLIYPLLRHIYPNANCLRRYDAEQQRKRYHLSWYHYAVGSKRNIKKRK